MFVIDAGFISPYLVVSIYSVFFEKSKKDNQTYCLFSRPANPIIVYGYHQDPDLEIDIQKCKQDNVKYTRRITGGGCVYLDKNQLCISFISKLTDTNNLEQIHSKYLAPIISALRSQGINAKFRPKNDIEVDGKKILGSSLSINGDRIVLATTLLLDFDFEKASKYLLISDEKFRDKQAKTLKERLTAVNFLKSDFDLDKFKQEVAINFANLSNEKPIFRNLTDQEIQDLEKTEKFYSSDTWLKSVSRDASIKKHSDSIFIEQKTQKGLVKVFAKKSSGILSAIYITGDFFTKDRNLIFKLESYLKWTKLSDLETNLDSFLEKNKQDEEILSSIKPILLKLKSQQT